MDEPRLILQPEQRVALLPTSLLMQFLSLLPVQAIDLNARIQAAISDNPVLERSPGWSCPTCGRHVRGRRCKVCAYVPLTHDPRADGDWRDSLKSTVRAELQPQDRALAEYIVDCLDDHGFLTDDGLSPPGCDPLVGRRVETIIEMIRTLGPAGIAATSPLDCVHRQVGRLVETGEAPALLGTIVANYLDLVAAGNVKRIATELGTSSDAVAAALTLLRRRVRPFVVLSSRSPSPIAPDLVIHVDQFDARGLVAVTTDAAWFGLQIDSAFLDGMTGEARAWAEPLRRQASDLLRQIEARASILRQIGDVLIDRQRDFLLGAIERHQPLRRTDAADALQVHPSTIGRAVSGKTLRCPDGRSVALADCFGARTGPTERLRLLMDRHPVANDSELCRLLAADGIVIARRTVAKYRASLHESSRPAKSTSLRR